MSGEYPAEQLSSHRRLEVRRFLYKGVMTTKELTSVVDGHLFGLSDREPVHGYALPARSAVGAAAGHHVVVDAVARQIECASGANGRPVEQREPEKKLVSIDFWVLSGGALMGAAGRQRPYPDQTVA